MLPPHFASGVFCLLILLFVFDIEESGGHHQDMGGNSPGHSTLQR